MKTIYVLLLTVTSWANGNPTYKEIGKYNTLKECEINKEQVLKSYKEKYPEGFIYVKEIICKKGNQI